MPQRSFLPGFALLVIACTVCSVPLSVPSQAQQPSERRASICGLDRGIPFREAFREFSARKRTTNEKDETKDTNNTNEKAVQTGKSKPVHVIYVLDVSGSMRAGLRNGKAQDALKQTLSELEPTDTFNILLFAAVPEPMFPQMVRANPKNIRKAQALLDEVLLRDGTNLSSAMELVWSLGKATHVILISDGEPSNGIIDLTDLRAFIKQENKEQTPILTLALGIRDAWPGKELLQGIAQDNRGAFGYVNVSAPKRQTSFQEDDRKILATGSSARDDREDFAVVEVLLNDILKNVIHKRGAEKSLDRVVLDQTGYETFRPKNKQIIVGDIKRIGDEFQKAEQRPGYMLELSQTYLREAMAKVFPRCQKYVKAERPRYSPEGTTTVTFRIGPELHGPGDGTYTLVKEKGRWRVIQRSLLYPQ